MLHVLSALWRSIHCLVLFIALHLGCPSRVFCFRYSWFSRDVRKTKIKLRLKILSSYLYRVKDIFKRISAGLFSARQTALLLKQNTVFSQCLTSALFLGNMLRARKYRFALCFRVLSNQYVERSAYANVFKFNREKKRFERAKVNSRCFHWFPVAMLESL